MSAENIPAPVFATLHPNLLIGVHRALSLLAARGQTTGGYFEFGLYRGFSFWFANNLAKEMGIKLEFHGFDSFEGLPPSEVDLHRNWQPGNYACSLEQVSSSLKQWGMPSPYTLHKGWYSAPFFAEIERRQPLPAPMIAVIDSDLYESATEVLQMLHPRLCVGTLLLFDDFNAFAGDPNHGERRALREFETVHPSFRKSSLFSFGPYGEAFEVTAL
jgi:O-methyltransferase